MILEILGYIGALLMGLVLGLIGGGGSILTVPILVYLFAVDTVLATTYSLFIVGASSLVGSYTHIKQGHIQWRMVLLFGLPSIISVYVTRMFILPIIPDTIWQVGEFILTKSILMLFVFAILMILTAFTMIAKKQFADSNHSEPKALNYPLMLIEGVLLGFVTGLVGAGGGFLIIPVLVLVANLSMKQAVGTSLAIITLKSLIGFLTDVYGGVTIDWLFLSSISSLAIIGILLGASVSKKVPNEKLGPIFGYFVLVMGIFILAKEILFNG